ncbi:hypothetical protein FRB90_007161, partial [Tulasnella sp. 427]
VLQTDMESSGASQKGFPLLSFEMLMIELEAAARVLEDNSEEEDSENEGSDSSGPERSIMKSLNLIAQLIRWAEVSKDAGALTNAPHSTEQSESTLLETDAWTSFLERADTLIGDLCSEIHDEGMASSVDPFAIPTTPGSHIVTKSYMAGSFASNTNFLMLLAGAMDNEPGAENLSDEQRIASMRQRMTLAGFIPPPWSESARPDPRSSLLARFDSTYDVCAVLDAAARSDTVSQSLDPSARRGQLLNVLFARAETRQKDRHHAAQGEPRRMAVGKNMIVFNEGRKVKRRAICPANHERKNEHDSRSWCDDSMYHGFGGELDELEIDSFGIIWAAKGSRVRAIGCQKEEDKEGESRGDVRLLWTLDSNGYRGSFAATDEGILRGGSRNRLAIWSRNELAISIAESMDMSKKDAVPARDGLKVVQFDRLISDVRVRGPPWSDWVLVRLLALLLLIRQVRYNIIPTLFTPCLMQDLPHLFVAAGDDPYTRIFDIRQSVLPQVLLNGHSASVDVCTIASHGGNFPIIFTGGQDELVKAWDIRHTKSCLYDLSTGTMHPAALEWHEDSQTLFLLGERVHKSDGSGSWPKNAVQREDYFGVPWYTRGHVLVEYLFKSDADPRKYP